MDSDSVNAGLVYYPVHWFTDHTLGSSAPLQGSALKPPTRGPGNQNVSNRLGPWQVEAEEG